MCIAPPKPPDRQNSLNDKASNREMPYVNPKRRPNIHYANEQGKSWDYRAPPKPSYLQNADGEWIEALKRENLPYAEPEYRPLPKPPRIQDNAEERIWPPPKPLNRKYR